MRTHLPTTHSSSKPRILREKSRSFCSSSVSADPLSTTSPAIGSTLNAVGATYEPMLFGALWAVADEGRSPMAVAGPRHRSSRPS